uniref:Uncharacterized protein n=1 Tax=Onchocerca volvulus TaxID=6282 RepID=A0A8R1XNT8_ONCVO
MSGNGSTENKKIARRTARARRMELNRTASITIMNCEKVSSELQKTAESSNPYDIFRKSRTALPHDGKHNFAKLQQLIAKPLAATAIAF